MNEVATTCDGCGSDITYGQTCYLVGTGEELDELQVAKVVCAECRPAA